MIESLRARFNERFTPERYAGLRKLLEDRCGAPISFRLAETPVFVPRALLEKMAQAGAKMTQALLADTEYLTAARRAIPKGYRVAGETMHPHFLTADFALVEGARGELEPRLVELQAFPSLYGFQAVLCEAYRSAFGLSANLGMFLSGLDEARYWELLRRTVVGTSDPGQVVLSEVDPWHQKTLPDFLVTIERLGIALVDIAELEAVGNELYFRNAAGRQVRIERLYNRAIADELIARKIALRFDLERPWTVEWAGHPNWYFLVSKFSVPWLSQHASGAGIVPPAVFLDDFMEGRGRATLEAAGVPLPPESDAGARYEELLLKPLFSFAGKGIVFAPTRRELAAIPANERGGYLVQQKMRFVPTIATPHGMTQAEFRILYLWPEDGELTPALSLARLGRGKMMGVDHNRDLEWVGASAALFPAEAS